jgi:hypothetical protein
MVYKQAVLGKSERKLVSSLAFSYLLSFLDRPSRHTFSFRLNTTAGIGNARIAGLEDSPFASAGQFNLNLIAFLQPVVTTFHQPLLLGVALGIIEAAWSWRTIQT